MATTQNLYTGNGSTTSFTFTFEYLNTTDIKVSLDGVDTTAYSLLNATTLVFNSAPANGVAIRIYRSSNLDTLQATFYPGSAIKSSDLNDNFTQNLFVTQESQRDVETANTTANTAKSTADTAIADSASAVTTANTASTNASAAVATANTASTNATNAVSTANTASNNATNALNTANTASAAAATAAAGVYSVTINANAGLNGDVNGNLTGNVNGNLTGNVTGNVTGNLTGNVTGNITASSYSGNAIITSGTSASDTQVYSAKRSDQLYYNKASGEEIASGETWVADDNKIATTAAIDARIVDLVDDVGGFVPIANETSFPNTNPDINNGTGTLVSVPLDNSLTANSSGDITINNGTVGNAAVTITGAEANETYAAGFGLLVETTTTQNVYKFHRYVPKATEVTTVASNITTINNVSNDIANINAVAAISSSVPTVASISSDVSTVAGIAADVTTVANDATDIGNVSTNIGAVAAIGSDLANNFSNITDYGSLTGSVSSTSGTSDITTVANKITEVDTVAGISADVTTVANNTSNINTVISNLTEIQTASTQAANAATSAAEASTHATNAANSATAAAGSVSAVQTSATEAAASATTASTSATEATTQATNAAASATNAAISETSASASASSASNSETLCLQFRSDTAGYLTRAQSTAYNINTNTFFGSIVNIGSNGFSNEITSGVTMLSMALGTSSFDYGTV